MINALFSDVVIAYGMGLGTASEITLALKVEKFVVLLNVTEVEHDFFSQFARNKVCVATDAHQAIAIAS